MKTEFFRLAMDLKKKEPNLSDESLPNWVKIDKKRFDRIKNQNQNAKNDNLQARPEGGSPTYFNESYKLIQDIEHSKITHEKALKMITDIRNDIKRIIDLVDFNENQVKVLNSLFIRDKTFTRELKWHKIIDSKYKLLRSKINLNLMLKI